MDYSGIINLVLVTIIYSTFISPNLQRLGEIRDEIINMDLPTTKGSAGANEELFDAARDALVIKLTRYQEKYREIMQFLHYFYGIVGIVFVIQILLFYFAEDHGAGNWSNLFIAGAVIIVLVLTLRKYMLRPWTVNSMQWLIQRGFPQLTLIKMFGGKLVLNQRVRNSIEDQEEVTSISVDSRVKLLGYRYVIAIENLDGDRLYYASSGVATKHVRSMKLIPTDGRSRHDLKLASVKLKPNNYRVRLIVFMAPFGGKHHPYETTMDLFIDEGHIMPPIPLNLEAASQRIQAVVKKKDGSRVLSLAVKEGNQQDVSLVSLLTSRSFQRVMGKTKRPIVLQSYNGNLGRYEIDKFCSRKNVLLQTLKRRITFRNNDISLQLVPKRKR